MFFIHALIHEFIHDLIHEFIHDLIHDLIHDFHPWLHLWLHTWLDPSTLSMTFIYDTYPWLSFNHDSMTSSMTSSMTWSMTSFMIPSMTIKQFIMTSTMNFEPWLHDLVHPCFPSISSSSSWHQKWLKKLLRHFHEKTMYLSDAGK